MILKTEHVQAFAYWRLSPSMRARCKWQPPSIHHLINLHAGERIDTISHNALHLAALRRRNGSPPFELSKWDLVNIPRRWFMFRRWARRLEESKS